MKLFSLFNMKCQGTSFLLIHRVDPHKTRSLVDLGYCVINRRCIRPSDSGFGREGNELTRWEARRSIERTASGPCRLVMPRITGKM